MIGTERLARAAGLALAFLFASAAGSPLLAQTGNVSATVHNLSVSGPGLIRSTSETEVCKFCHIPHTAVVPVPLWGHALSEVAGYQTAPIRDGADSHRPAPQPDGSSRLCLSCHDGTVAIGQIGNRPEIPMTGGPTLHPGQRGYLGTDLSGGHPISFSVRELEHRSEGPSHDMTLRPVSAIEADREVRLDADGKMQCTTCHDPHSDKNYDAGRVPHFWVKHTVAEVCQTCHELR